MTNDETTAAAAKRARTIGELAKAAARAGLELSARELCDWVDENGLVDAYAELTAADADALCAAELEAQRRGL